MKYCHKCECNKPLDQFYRNSGNRDGLGSCCKDCKLAESHIYNPRNNPRNNEISRVAYSLVGGYSRFYSLDKAHRKRLRRAARTIVDTRMDATELYQSVDRVFEQKHPGGFVYAVTNSAWPGWVKVGMTTDPARRLNDYQTSSPHRDYEMVAFKEVDDRRRVETELHSELEAFGRREGEWFEVPVSFVASRLA